MRFIKPFTGLYKLASQQWTKSHRRVLAKDEELEARNYDYES